MRNKRSLIAAVAALNCAFVVLGFMSTPAGATPSTPTLVQSSATYTGSSGTSLTKVFASNVTAGNLLVASAFWIDSGSITAACSDSQGNAYTTAVSVTAAGSGSSMLTCYAFAATSGANTFTITYSASTTSRGAAVSEFTGTATSNPIDVTSSALGYVSAGTAIYGGTATTASDGDLIYGSLYANSLDSTSVGPSFVQSSLTVKTQTEYAVQSYAGSATVSGTTLSTGTYVGNLVAIRASAVERGVALTATVDPAFGFTVAAHSGTCNGFAQTGSASPTAAALGHVTAGTPGVAAQDLTVASNANSGYSVKLKTTGALASGANSIAAAPGTNAAPAAFPSTGTAAFGYTTSGLVRFASLWAGADTNFSDVMTSAATGTATSCVAYKAQVTALTPAGTYSATAIYSAVPSF